MPTKEAVDALFTALSKAGLIVLAISLLIAAFTQSRK